MKTALDEYKNRYGMRNKCDGAVVLKHAEHGNFRDSVMGTVLGVEQLKKLGVTEEMTREDITHRLRTSDREVEQLAWIHRYSIQLIFDFCTTQVMASNSFYEEEPESPPKTAWNEILQKVDSGLIDPIFDAIGRKIHTGSFFRKSKK